MNTAAVARLTNEGNASPGIIFCLWKQLERAHRPVQAKQGLCTSSHGKRAATPNMPLLDYHFCN